MGQRSAFPPAMGDPKVPLLLGVVLLVVLVILVLVIVLLVVRGLAGRGSGSTGTGTGTGTSTGTGPVIPDQLAGPDVARYLAVRLAGTTADGSAPPASVPARVVWVDHGDEVLVHLDSTTTQIAGRSLLVSIELECDQTGRTPLVVAFALPLDEAAGLVLATDEYPRGNGLLAARWGPAVQSAAWSALLTLAGDHAAERDLAPRGLTVTGGQLRLIAGPGLVAATQLKAG
jgi:hypothetical protein